MGCDKAELRIDNLALWQRQLGVLSATGSVEIVVSGTRKWIGKTGAYPVIMDDVDGQGPLGAIATLLRRSMHKGVLVVGVDLPNITAEILRDVAKIGIAHDVSVIPDLNGQWQPLAAYYARRCLPVLEDQLATGDLAMHSFARRAAGEGLANLWPIDNVFQGLFVNLNTPADFEAYCRRREC